MESAPEAVKSPSVEVSLRSAGADGLTIRELMDACELPETTVRRKIQAHLDAGEVYKNPTLDGAKIVWGDQPINAKVKPVNPRRRDAADRDEKILEILRVNGEITMNEIARILEVPDIDQDGWSQLVYVSMRRLRKRGLCERVITWKYLGPPEGVQED
jgi:hypothetical protein